MIAQNSSEWRNIHAGVRWSGRWPQGFVEANRRLYDYELVFFASGQGRVVTAESTLYCREGSLVIVPPKLIHCTVADSEVERWCIHFAWRDDCPVHAGNRTPYVYQNGQAIFDETAAAGPPAFPAAFPLLRHLNGEGARRMMRLLREYFMDLPGDMSGMFQAQGLLLQILSAALATSPSSDPSGPVRGNVRFFAAKSLIDRHYRDPGLRIRDIAGKVQVTPNHLVKLFRTHLGISVSDYLHTRRLEHACALLRRTALTIREAAADSGFDDANYFARYFRRRRGITPGEYRRTAAGPVSDASE